MDPLHLCIALGPLAVYFFVLGAINLSRRPYVTNGARDSAVLGIAVSGFVIAGPMELFFPEAAAVRFGGLVWGLLIAFYLLCLAMVVLMGRPRLVVFNATFDQIRPVLADVVTRLDDQSRWAGESLFMPNLGVQLSIETLTVMKNVQLVAAGLSQNYQGWRKLEEELAVALRQSKGSPNPQGAGLFSIGICTALLITYLLMRDPVRVQQAFTEMLRLEEPRKAAQPQPAPPAETQQQ